MDMYMINTLINVVKSFKGSEYNDINSIIAKYF